MEVSSQAHMHIRLQKWGFIGQEKDVTDKHVKSSQRAGVKEIRNQTSRRNAMKLCFQNLFPYLQTSGCPGQSVHTQTPGTCMLVLLQSPDQGNRRV